MEIWLDTIDIETVADAAERGVISGVTTNPSVLAQSQNPRQTIEQLLDLQPGLVALQVTTDQSREMFEEGDEIARFSDRIMVKVPVNREGLVAIRRLSDEGVPVIATGILHPTQALMASRAGAIMIAPYFGKMEEDPHAQLRAMIELIEAEILVASVPSVEDILLFSDLGVEGVTIKPELYHQLVSNNPKSQHYTDRFNQEWRSSHRQTLGALLH